MTALAIGIATAAIVLALWDGVRRSLDAQVRMAELRVEGMQRADYAAAMVRFAEVEAMVKATRALVDSLDTAHALDRRRPRA